MFEIDEPEDIFEKISNEKLELMLGAARHQCIKILKTPKPDSIGTEGCWFGGNPHLPKSMKWPTYQSSDGFSVPLHFVVQIDFNHLPLLTDCPELPCVGKLMLFIEPIYYYEHLFKGKGVSIIYIDDSEADCSEVEMPPLEDYSHSDHELSSEYYNDIYIRFKNQKPDRLSKGYKEWNIRFVFSNIYRNFFKNRQFQISSAKLNIKEVEKTRIMQEKNWEEGVSDSNVIVDHGLFCNYVANDDRVDQYGKGDMVQLLKIDTDEALHFSFDACKCLTVWISREDLRNCDFDESVIMVGENI